MLSLNDLKTGTFFKFQAEPFQVLFRQHVQMGRGGAILRTKVKNLITGHLLEKSFKPGDKFEEADLARSRANFLYQEGENYFFMDTKSYQQFSLNKNKVVEKIKYIKEGSDVDVLNFENKPINVDIPVKMDLKVTQAAEAIRGNTAQGSVTKEATLETGHKVKVPLFIKNGDMVRVNTETGKYVERVQK